MCVWSVEVREPSADPVGDFARRWWGRLACLVGFIVVIEILDLVTII